MGETIRGSRWMFPVIESAHLLAQGLLIGTVLIVNLRFFGLGMRRTPAHRVAAQLEPLTLGAVCASLVSGSLMFSADPEKFAGDGALPYKLGVLGVAIMFQCTLHRQATHGAGSNTGPLNGRTAAAISLTLWSAVAVLGRAIGVFV